MENNPTSSELSQVPSTSNGIKKIFLPFLIVFLIVVLGLSYLIFIKGNSKTSALPPEEAKARALTFINENLLPAGITASVDSIVKENGMYKLSLGFSNGNKVDSYLTVDGKYFFPEAMDIDAIALQKTLPTNENPVSNLQVETLQEGSGELAVKSGDSITVDYTGTLEDGTKFDSSLDRGQPYTFTIGQGAVIEGWDQGLIGMKVGEERKLTIPSELGYGSTGSGDKIPPNATLIFTVKLISIN